MNKKIFSILTIVFGAILLVSLFTFAPVCPPMDDGKFMKCHWTSQAVKGISILMIFVGALASFIKEEGVFKLLAPIGMGISALIIGIVTSLIGTCMKPDMVCNLGFKPTMLLIAGIYFLMSAFATFKAYSKNSLNA